MEEKVIITLVIAVLCFAIYFIIRTIELQNMAKMQSGTSIPIVKPRSKRQCCRIKKRELWKRKNLQ